MILSTKWASEKLKHPHDAIVYVDDTAVIAADSFGNEIASGVAGTDDAAIIQAAQDSLPLGRTRKGIIFLQGNFTILSAIMQKSYTEWRGDAVLNAGPSNNIFDFDSTYPYTNLTDISFRDLRFIQPNAQAGIGINLFYYDETHFAPIHNNIIIENCLFKNFAKGVYIISANTHFTRNTFNLNYNGINTESSGTYYIYNNNFIVDRSQYIVGDGPCGLWVEDSNFVCHDNNFSAVGVDANSTNLNWGIKVISCLTTPWNEIFRNKFDGFSTAGIAIDWQTRPMGTQHLWIKDNLFYFCGYYPGNDWTVGAISAGTKSVAQPSTDITIEDNFINWCYNILDCGDQGHGLNIPNTVTLRRNHLSHGVAGIRLYGNAFTALIEDNEMYYLTGVPVVGAGMLKGRRNIGGILFENKGSATGTGTQQTIAHGLMAAPSKVVIVPTVTGVTIGSWWADSSNIYIIITNGKTFNWFAEA